MSKVKTAIVTGGGTGIGRAVSVALGKKGMNVVVNYSRSEQEAMETAELIRQAGASCLTVKADVSSDEQVKQLIKATATQFGGIDYLVNCAGVTNFVNLNDLDGLKEEYWDRAMGVNVKGPFFVSRAAAPYLKESRGAIVSITSIAGMIGRGSSIAYCASKAAEISLTKSLALVLAPEVRVNCVSPGIVLTRWLTGNETHIERMSSGTPLQKVCTPDDVAEVAVDLLVGSAMVTGQNIVVDGGYII